MMSQNSKIKRLKNLSLMIFLAPTILLFPLVYVLFFDPWFIIGAWDIYLMFFITPYSISLALWLYARRNQRVTMDGARSD